MFLRKWSGIHGAGQSTGHGSLCIRGKLIGITAWKSGVVQRRSKDAVNINNRRGALYHMANSWVPME